jgi:uncharacterized membrane protein
MASAQAGGGYGARVSAAPTSASGAFAAVARDFRESPVVVKQRLHRTEDVQLRVADAITKFAGSMAFVYLHILVFAVWMLVVEKSPWPTLTLIVSLEAIFLSTFVMIGQNRAASFQQEKANHDFNQQERELLDNTQLTREIHRLTTELHRRAFGEAEPSR